ncbi:psbP domain-containing protein 1, chloroplastic isoform X1 [Physcomitrium patens]|uniref:PsbP C-terminal domain-containing protein n=2 Tax=Physcomitrium patens TaxID=3218 RepID=A0A7I4FFX5_PHYPA|nr:psbP domain-containing protein 1, chloroplastic-like isoform X1 [Physcomitrium patens]|eukprot:XP_024361843.1 psbP domain-containing protein 1, chloroplastic-like isoform X1 [Physcomitrella patens]
MLLSACCNCTMTLLQPVVGALYRPRISGLGSEGFNVRRCWDKKLLHCQSNFIAVAARSVAVAELGKSELGYDISSKRGVNPGASFTVPLLAAILISCPPALSAEMAMDSANTQCSLKRVQANGYDYAYPECWVRDKIRGIEVLAHDPEVSELNMSIFTSPVQSGTLSGSAEEVGGAIIAQYLKSPTISKAELLGVVLKEDESSNRIYSFELSVEAGSKQRHLLTKLIRTDRKVLSLTLQVPEELWSSYASCMKSVTDNFKQTTLM